MNQLICTLALLSASMTPMLTAQDTWVADVSNEINHRLASAVSEGGRIALVHTHELDGTGISILSANATPIYDFQINPSTGQSIKINDTLFLNETTLIVAGSIEHTPYMGAFHIGTGTAIWEESLTKTGEFQDLTINSIGKIIGSGKTRDNGATQGLVCAVNPGGGWSWFRNYNPANSNHNSVNEVVPLPGGDMYLLCNSSTGLSISRLTDWGHEIWSRWYEPEALVISDTRSCIASNGDLMVVGRYYVSATSIDNALMRISPDGTVVSTNRYQLPGWNSAVTLISSIIPTGDNGVILGGLAYPSGSWAPVMVKLDASGDVDWARSTPFESSYPNCTALSDGGFLAIAHLSGTGARIFRMNAMGSAGVCGDNDIPLTPLATTVQSTPFTYHYDPYPGVFANNTTTTSASTSQVDILCHSSDTVGTTFCDPANPNSTGFSTRLTGNYSGSVGFGLHLEARQGPPSQFGYFLVGTGFNDPGIVISQGRFCLSSVGGNQFGRYNVSGGPLNSLGQFDSAGILQNLSGTSAAGPGFDVPFALPGMGGNMTSGQTWHFQLWHRESGGQSNLSNGIRVDI